jgi:hypothetical protein
MADVKTGYSAGGRVAKATNPVGDNVGANFARGFMLYHDKEVAAKRNVRIEQDKAAFKAYLLSQE